MLFGRTLTMARLLAFALGVVSIAPPFLALRLVGMTRWVACLATALAMASPELRLFDISRTTRQFLDLERGRCLAVLGRWAEALEAFDRCVDAQAGDDAYPRLGGMRGRALALRKLGRMSEAMEALQACLRVATPEKGMLGKVAVTMAPVAVMAAGDAMTDREYAGTVGRDELERAWKTVMGDVDPEVVLRGWVY